MPKIIYQGLDELLPLIRNNYEGDYEKLNGLASEPSFMDSAEVVIIGPGEANPVKQVQKIHAADKYISIIVVSLPSDFKQVKQSLQFAPYVGQNTLCISFSNELDFHSIINNAVTRTRQRRNFSRFNKAPVSVSSIATSSVKVENLGIFLESAPIGALLVDEESRILAINNKAKEVLNAEDGKLYVLKDFFPSFSLQQFKIGFSPETKSSRVLEYENHFFEVHLSEVKGEEGKTLNVFLINDITEQKKKENALKESEALFRFMAEAMPQKIWTADEKGNRNFFNQRWVDYTGYSMDELKGWGWLQLIHPDDQEETRSAWEHSIATGIDFEVENRLLRKDGSFRWHLVRGITRRDSDGKILMWIGTNTDIQDQKLFAEELEKRVKERTFELEQTNHELEQFVYVTSHDLQEPLRKIRMFSEMMKDAAGSMEEVSRRHLEKISATALRMSTLLKELLNFTRLNKQEQFEPTDLNEILSRVMLDLELLVSESGAEVKAEVLPQIVAIPVQMHQLFYNLVNNAIKFAREGVKPEILIRSQTAGEESLERFIHRENGKKYCEIIVSDNGIGFDQVYADQIFHIFQRLHNRSEYSGTGIGLALCKKVVSNHFGHIYALSQQGKGTEFHILLPLEQ